MTHQDADLDLSCPGLGQNDVALGLGQLVVKRIDTCPCSSQSLEGVESSLRGSKPGKLHEISKLGSPRTD